MERTDREPKEPHLLNAEFVDVQSKIVSLSEAGGSDNQEKISELKIQRNNLLEDKRVKYKLDQVRRQAIEALNTSDNFDQFDRKLNDLIDDDSSDSMNDIRKEALYQIRLQAHLQVKTDAIKKRFEEDPSINLTDEYNALQEDKEYKKFERVRFFEPADSESQVDFNTPYQEFIQRQKKDSSDDFDISEELRTDEDTPANPFRPQQSSRGSDSGQQKPESDEDDDEYRRFMGMPTKEEERLSELDALLNEEVGSAVDERGNQDSTIRRNIEEDDALFDEEDYNPSRRFRVNLNRNENNSTSEKERNAREQYIKTFLNEEAKLNNSLQKLNVDVRYNNLPPYYEMMTDEEQVEHNTRRELALLVASKNRVNNLEEYSRLGKFSEFSNEDASVLERIPGMVEARAIYIAMADKDEPVPLKYKDESGNVTVKLKRWSECGKGISELSRYREYIRESVGEIALAGQIKRNDKLREKVSSLDPESEEYKEILDLYAREAEQVAFNTLYAMNYFESVEAKWKGNRREVRPANQSSAIKDVIVNAMNPLDKFIANATKAPEAFKSPDTLTNLAHKYLWEDARKKGVDLSKGVNEIVILPNDKSSENKFWTVEKFNKNNTSGVRIYIYSPYFEPDGLFKSLLTKTEVNGGTALDYAKAGKAIPWSDLGSNSFADMTNDAGNAFKYLEFLSGKKNLQVVTPGGGANTAEWVRDAQVIAGSFKQRGNMEFYRGMIYSSAFLDEKSRAPKIRAGHVTLEGDLYEHHLITDHKEAFYPWDRKLRW